MFQATRRRLAIWYTAVTAVLLLLFASGFYFYVRSTLIERIDDTLSHVVEVVERSLVLENTLNPTSKPYQVNLEASLRSNSQVTEDDHIDLEWFSPTRELLWSTLSEPSALPVHANSSGETVHLSQDRLSRQMTERIAVGRQVLGYLRVSHPWFEVTKPTQQLIVDLLLGTLLTVTLVAAVGWFLSRLAMEPIRESYQRLKQFTADASHELRNPIALIQTNVQVALAAPDADPQEQRQQLEVVERLTRRLGRLVDDLLFLARQDSSTVQSQFQPCPLDALLMEVVEEQQAIAAAKDITLSLDLDEPSGTSTIPGEDPFTLPADYDQLFRLFTNLITNGIQYTPPGGKVHLSLQYLYRGGTAYLQVQVRDSGTGIPEAALPHLFDRFYRVDPARSRGQNAESRVVASSGIEGTSKVNTGSGLGLAIAQAIIETHHGQLRVESTLNQGTTFFVLLPRPETIA